MNENLNPERAGTILADCVSSVFADMAFIDVERGRSATGESPVERGNGPQAERSTVTARGANGERRAAIDVLSPLSCRIELTINQAIRDRIFETLFGDASESEQKKAAEDPLLEMLNIIAGSFLSGYFGPGVDIQLELPRYLYLGEVSPGQTVSAISLDAEGQPLEAAISSVRYRY